MPGDERRAHAEATALFWYFTIALKVVPFRRFRRVLGAPGLGPDPVRPAPSVPVGREVGLVGRSIRRLARHHPDTCLAQALAGRVMLRRRCLPSTISFGVRGDVDGGHQFHAWLLHGGRIVSGGPAVRSFSVIATFHDEPGGPGPHARRLGSVPRRRECR